MDFEYAQILTLKHKHTARTIHVTSDGSVYLNGNIEVIEQHANEQDLEVFHIKPEKAEEKKETKKKK